MCPSKIDRTGGVPEIPDLPNSPLSGWKHYYILKELEKKFHAQLEQQKYAGRLVGLDVTYKVGEYPYTMNYGYNIDTQGNLLDEKDDPLDDPFVMEVYDLAIDLITQHISPHVLNFSVEISASINPNFSNIKVLCMTATAANCSRQSCQGKCRMFIKRNNGPWECQHFKGKCSCSG